MRVPLSWLSEYVPLRMNPPELAYRLTMAGLETTYDAGVGAGWESVVVGHVAEVRPHPNADRLRLVDVALGATTHTVVCGAPNVATGQKIAFAQVGARLKSGKAGEPMELTAAVIRGVESAGMVCSERELGLSDEHEGILVLPDSSPVGAPLSSVLPSGDALEIEITANRGDCLSVLGIAHEVAAITGERVTEPSTDYAESGEEVSGAVAIEIADPDLCYRYTCTLTRSVMIGPSPEWLRQRLQEAGHRSINNVVDVTNYVMLEYGQPLHAFDLAEVRGSKVIVRSAAQGEPFTSLDGQEHTLRPPMLMIADPERAIGLAGVMGGANSEMTDSTTNVLLESATFNAINTRRTANALKLRTDASLRFEKGLNPELAERAVRRATRLILETAGGMAAKGVYDVFPGKSDPPRIAFSHESLRRVLGADFPTAQVTGVLASLGFSVELNADDSMTVVPPYWRTDIHIEEDVVEEIARIIGYDAVPGAPLAGLMPEAIPQPVRELREEVRDLLVTSGLQETISYTLVSKEHASLPGGLSGEPLHAANPMSREQEYLRMSLRPNILRAAASALRQPPGSALLFEVGRVFIPRNGDLPDERETAVGIVAGPRPGAVWQKDAPPFDFFDAKGIVEGLLTRLGLNPTFERASDAMLHDGRAAAIMADGEQVGVVGEIHPRFRAAFDFDTESPALFELDLQRLVSHLPQLRSSFEAFSRYPSAVRDLALVLNSVTPSQQAQDIIESNPLVVRSTLFDVFEGGTLPAGKKSLAFRLELQSSRETLTSDQLNAAIADITSRLERETGATLRA